MINIFEYKQILIIFKVVVATEFVNIITIQKYYRTFKCSKTQRLLVSLTYKKLNIV